jgi:hypothetical protein
MVDAKSAKPRGARGAVFGASLLVACSGATARNPTRDPPPDAGTAEASVKDEALAKDEFDFVHPQNPRPLPGVYEESDETREDPRIEAATSPPELHTMALTSGWRAMAPSTTVSVAGRYDPAVIWAGDRLLVWGGVEYDNGPKLKNDGAWYLPMTDTWTKLPPVALAARSRHQVVWTGKRMYVWGGFSGGLYYGDTRMKDGASYTPSTNRWFIIPAARTSLQCEPTAVWSTTTNDILLWGCYKPNETINGTGMRYHPSTYQWYYLPKAPLRTRRGHSATWTGKEMVVWGGRDAVTGEPLNDGAAYDPVTKRWRMLPPPTLHWSDGSSSDLLARYGHTGVATGPTRALVTVFGGYAAQPTGGGFAPGDGATWDPASGGWTYVRGPTFSDYTVGDATVFWGNGRLWQFGGTTDGTYVDRRETFVYDPTTGTWSALPIEGSPTWRHRAYGAWTGSEAIVYGGLAIEGTPGNETDGLQPLATGGIYRP